MKLKLGLKEGLGVIRTLLRMSDKSAASLVISGIKNYRQRSDLTEVLTFLFGQRESYFGVIINQKRRVKHSLYLLINNGKIKEVGSVKLKSKTLTKSLNELYSKLEKKGEVSKVMSYGNGGNVLFHPLN